MFGIKDILVLSAGLLIGYSMGLLSGMPIGKNIAQGNQAVAVVEEVQKNVNAKRKNKQVVNSLSNDELIMRYCHWVYDVPYSECIRTVVPIE